MWDDREWLNELMDLAAEGSHSAFAAVAAASQDELSRFAIAHGLRATDAAEVTQEALLRAYSGLRRWRKGADAAAWLCGIAMNVVRESFRKGKGRHETNGHDLDSLIEDVDGEDSPGRDALLQSLAEAVKSLPPRQREAVSCRYLRRMSVRDTAGAMGCAEGTVKAAVFAAMENLRSAMKMQGE
jgi:RNA polymerase sigma-70 factor (ECF subfamily)